MGRAIGRAVVLALLVIGIAVAVFEWRATRPPAAVATVAPPVDAPTVQRGAYLAVAGHCAGCHTARGGKPMTGGRAIDTPFGRVASANLTPDVDTGLGAWTSNDFHRAMHEGRSRGGRLLVPACPYPNFTRVTRADTDAIFAWLRSLEPVRQERSVDVGLRFPFGLQTSLAVWRAWSFTPGVLSDDASQSAAWNRGRYLVHGLAHCGACHGARDALGAARDDLTSGAPMPSQRWYAPSLGSTREAGMSAWTQDEAMAFLAHGRNRHASAIGPMAEVVARSTQHLEPADLEAMAWYLRALPVVADSPAAVSRASRSTLEAGARIYDEHCSDCHGKRGEGVDGRWPALAGNRAVLLGVADNVVQSILQGGFTPATSGNPRPHGMPPFAHVLDDEAVAAVATYVRQSWGNTAGGVSAFDVMRVR